MLRQATHQDIQRLVELGARMHIESPTFRAMTFNPDKLSTAIANAIQVGFAQVYECDGEIHGAMLALAVPHFFSDDLAACDLALFIEPESRGTSAGARLLRAYEAWARERGAALIQFGIMSGVDVEKTQALCERLGWKRCGVVMGI